MENAPGVSSFDPEHTEAMATAVEDTCLLLASSGRRFVKDMVAKKVLEIAYGGERDACRLRNLTLKEFGVTE